MTTPDSDFTETTELFKSSVQPLDTEPTPQEGLPFGGLFGSSKGFLMCRVGVNDGFSPTLPLNQATQGITGVPSVTDNVVGMELAGCEPSLPEESRGSMRWTPKFGQVAKRESRS